MTRARTSDAASLGGGTLIVFGGNLFTLAVGLPFQIYLANSLGAAPLGLYGLVEAAVMTMAGLVSLGVAPTVVRFLPEHLAKGETAHVRTLMAGATLAMLVVGLLLVALIRGGSASIVALWRLDPSAGDLVALMALAAPLSMLTYLYQQVLRGFHAIEAMILVSSGFALTLKVALAVMFLRAGRGVEGYALAVVLSSAGALALLMLLAWKKVLRLPPGRNAGAAPLRRWVHFAALSYARALLGSLTAYLDRFVVGSLLGSSSVAVLMIANQLAQLPAVLNNGFLTVAAPMFAAASSLRDTARRSTLFHMTNDWVVRLSLPLVLFLVVFAGPLLGLYGDEFREHGVAVMVVALLATTVGIAAGPTGSLLLMSGEEAVHLRVTLLCAIVQVATLLVLVPCLGLVGTGLAQLAAALVFAAAELTLARRRLGVDWLEGRARTWAAPALASLAAVVAARVALDAGATSTTATAVWLVLAIVLAYAAAGLVVLVAGLGEADRAVVDALAGRLASWRRSVARRTAP